MCSLHVLLLKLHFLYVYDIPFQRSSPWLQATGKQQLNRCFVWAERHKFLWSVCGNVRTIDCHVLRVNFPSVLTEERGRIVSTILQLYPETHDRREPWYPNSSSTKPSALCSRIQRQRYLTFVLSICKQKGNLLIKRIKTLLMCLWITWLLMYDALQSTDPWLPFIFIRGQFSCCFSEKSLSFQTQMAQWRTLFMSIFTREWVLGEQWVWGGGCKISTGNHDTLLPTWLLFTVVPISLF